MKMVGSPQKMKQLSKMMKGGKGMAGMKLPGM
jgi:hypothetical protein